MAYPFVQLPTAAEFVAAVKKKHGCHLVKETVHFNDKRKTMFFLQKGADAEYRVPLPPAYSENKDMRLTPGEIRLLCRRLKIPVKEWLPLG